MEDSIYISVVVPCYNEEDCLTALYTRLTRVLQSIGESYEVILINDGSKDTTWRLISTMCHQDKHLVGIDLSRNFGQEAALMAGLARARGEFILVLDADLQDPPELLPEMLQMALCEGLDAVYGKRRTRQGEGVFKRWTAWCFYRVLKSVSEYPIPQNCGLFRLMRRRVVQAILSMPEHNRFFRGLAVWVGFKQAAFDFDRPPRLAGQTGWPTHKMWRLAIDSLTSFSFKPLRMFGWLALLIGALASVSLGYWITARLALGTNVNDMWFFMAIMLLLAAFQLACMAISCEYLVHVVNAARCRPIYIVNEVLNECSCLSSESPGLHVSRAFGSDRNYRVDPRAIAACGADGT